MEPHYELFVDQELKGRFVIKGKCLNKLEDYLSDEATTEEESVTEEDDSRDEEEVEHSENKVCRVH